MNSFNKNVQSLIQERIRHNPSKILAQPDSSGYEVRPGRNSTTPCFLPRGLIYNPRIEYRTMLLHISALAIFCILVMRELISLTPYLQYG
jgi:hypothetical protein